MSDCGNHSVNTSSRTFKTGKWEAYNIISRELEEI